MPKPTKFEIRDVRPESGYVLTAEQVKVEMPVGYKLFMKQLGRLQDYRVDYRALMSTGRVFKFGDTSRKLLKFAFFRFGELVSSPSY